MSTTWRRLGGRGAQRRSAALLTRIYKEETESSLDPSFKKAVFWLKENC